MTIKRILIILVTVAATTPVYSKHVLDKKELISDYYDIFPDPIEVEYTYYNEINFEPTFCGTDDCFRVAARIVGAMNKSVDPCVDFYEFTCGNWNNDHPIIPNAMVSNEFEVNDRIVQQRISEIFEKDPDSSDIPPVKMEKKWYRSCMDTESLNAKGMKPIQEILKQVGGWPLSMGENEWSAEDNPWQKIESFYAGLMGRNVFYDVQVGKPGRDSKIGRIVLHPPELLEKKRAGILRYNGMYTSLIEKVVKMIMKITKAEVPHAVLHKRIQNLTQFESEILALIKEPSPGNSVYWPGNPLKFGYLVDWYSTWMKYKYPTSKKAIDFETGIKQIFRPLAVKINVTEPIIVSTFRYFERIGDLLERTPAQTIVDYVHWNFIATVLKHTTEEIRDDLFAFSSYYGPYLGAKKRSPRSIECAEETTMRYAAAYAWAKKYFTPSTESAAREMMRNIQKGMEDNIENSDWLDDQSKLLARSKIEVTPVFAGYPKWFRNDTAVTNYYKGLTMGDQYLDNVLSYMRFDIKRRMMAPVISGDDEYDFINPLSVGARYNGYRNSVDLPQAIFQPPLFTPGLPEYINYGHAGFLVGHEFGHGFDDKRFNQFKYGKLGLREQIEQNYYKRARCFINQYNTYFRKNKIAKNKDPLVKDPDEDVKFGSNSQSENIADSTGLQAVYQAYKLLKLSRGTNEPKLPGLEGFTDDQLFFISFGSSFCNRKTPTSDKINEDSSYSPARLRINGPVSNTDDFAKVFSCRTGSPMNPMDKCSVWRRTSTESGVINIRWIED